LFRLAVAEAIPQLSVLPPSMSAAVIVAVPVLISREIEISLHIAVGLILSVTVTVKLHVAESPNASVTV